jgi:hypothetical protein
VLRRFDTVLAPDKQAVLEAAAKFGGSPLADAMLRKASGFEFYNPSRFTFERLLDAPNAVEANFRAHLNGFSDNVKQLVEKFKPFAQHLATMAEHNILYGVLKEITTQKPTCTRTAFPTSKWAISSRNSSAAFRKRTTRTPGSITRRARSSSSWSTLSSPTSARCSPAAR